MATVHASLTGANVHEPKGADTAANGTVYVANGSGSGSWTAHSTFSGAFANNYVQVRDVQAATDNGGVLASGSWNLVRLNSNPVNLISGFVLAGNQMQLPSGTYWCQGWTRLAGTIGAEVGATRIQNVTAGNTLVSGGSIRLAAASGGVSMSGDAYMHIQGRFDLAATSVVEFQEFVSGGGTIRGGYANGTAVNIYSDLVIWKVA